MRRQDLRKAACVRALLGTPVLILLENPTYGAYADLIAPLLNTVRGARNRGAAVVWTTLELEVWNNPGLRATQRGKMVGSQLQVMREKGEVS
jgi:phospholipid/cholesterol/gamma-HCH transport system ATP-binding protein